MVTWPHMVLVVVVAIQTFFVLFLQVVIISGDGGQVFQSRHHFSLHAFKESLKRLLV